MELRDWLHKKRMKIKEFASICEIGRVHMQNINGGKRIPGPKLVRKIEEATSGEVTRYDLLKDYQEKNR